MLNHLKADFIESSINFHPLFLLLSLCKRKQNWELALKQMSSKSNIHPPHKIQTILSENDRWHNNMFTEKNAQLNEIQSNQNLLRPSHCVKITRKCQDQFAPISIYLHSSLFFFFFVSRTIRESTSLNVHDMGWYKIPLTIPIKKEDWKSKNKQKKQEKGPATAIPLYSLRQLFITKLNILRGFNCLL